MMRFFEIAISLLVVPLALLLFAQWPLRDWIGLYARQANDLAQAIFAIYIAVAITAATRHNAHLESATQEQAAAPSWKKWAIFSCVAPWAAFSLWSSAPQALRSIRSLERFPDTGNPGYFLVVFACALLALLALLAAFWQLAKRR